MPTHSSLQSRNCDVIFATDNRFLSMHFNIILDSGSYDTLGLYHPHQPLPSVENKKAKQESMEVLYNINMTFTSNDKNGLICSLLIVLSPLKETMNYFFFTEDVKFFSLMQLGQLNKCGKKFIICLFYLFTMKGIILTY